jgi:cysteine desulfurase
MAERVYLDWNATAPLRPQAREAMIAALDTIGNPSSVHAEGRASRRLVDEARRRVAALVGAQPADVVFTSGGTEANALALAPGLQAGRGPQVLVVSAIEHPSVLAGGRFAADAVTKVPVDADGRVDLRALERHLAALERDGRGRALVSLMHANNETGVVQPVAAAAAIVHQTGGLLHVDAVQGAGRIPCDINELGADLLTISGHKLGGPQGVGALVRRGASNWAEPLIKGGGQERGARAGTENVAAIAGFGAAATAAARDRDAELQRLAGLRDRLEASLKADFPDVTVFGAGAERLPNTTLFAVPGAKAETAVIGLDLAGMAVSSGAACSSGKVAASHVLAAMGVPPALARGAVRASLGYASEESDVDRFLFAWTGLAQTLLKGSHGIAA